MGYVGETSVTLELEEKEDNKWTMNNWDNSLFADMCH